MKKLAAISFVVATLVVACSDDDGEGLRAPTRSAPIDAGEAPSKETPKPGASTTADAASPTTPEPQGEEESGEATYYDADGMGACGSPTSNASLVAAMNGVQYSKAVCGKCAFVTGPLGSVTVKIVDKCPGCDKGDLDLSETAFAKIAKLSAGRVKITWRFAACP